MTAKEETRKEKPSVETVQETVRASDLLAIEVCKPLKEQLDKIEVCKPQIVTEVECVPTRFCKPVIFCKPALSCLPDRLCRPIYSCKPDIFCRPDFFCIPDRMCKPLYYQQCTPSTTPWEIPWEQFEIPEYRQFSYEMKEMYKVLEEVKLEIQELRKRIK